MSSAIKITKQKSDHKSPKGGNANTNTGNANVSLPKIPNASNGNLRKSAQNSSVTRIVNTPRNENQQGGSAGSTRTSKRRNRSKPYEPIRLPEDILTIQAHTASTPVTELPYLLIAAHIGALPTARQFYPATSASHSPLTVFRDMFVMTIDVRGYKPSSVRLSTEGRLIIIECLQSEVPQVVFTQTGTVDTNNKYVMDPPPKMNDLPVHTSFNYVQHRVKLPEDFSEEGLKVGMDDVSGHVIITGRLVHNQKAAFPEPWNQNKIVKKPKGPLVNTSSVNLSKEDARKLAAWNAVQGSPQGKMEEIGNTNLLAYGKKQWLEKEGAKLRGIQHRALKENIRKLTEMKKGSTVVHSQPVPPSAEYGLHNVTSDQKFQSKEFKPRVEGKQETAKVQESRSNVFNVPVNQNNVTPFGQAKNFEDKNSSQQGNAAKSETRGTRVPTVKAKESRPKVSFQQDANKVPLTAKKSSVKADLAAKKKSRKLAPKIVKRKSKSVDEKRKPMKSKPEDTRFDKNDKKIKPTVPGMQKPVDPDNNSNEVANSILGTSGLIPETLQTMRQTPTEPGQLLADNSAVPLTVADPANPSQLDLPVIINVSQGDASQSKLGNPSDYSITTDTTPSSIAPSIGQDEISEAKLPPISKSKHAGKVISSSDPGIEINPAPKPAVKGVERRHPVSTEPDDGDDPVGKQDKAMWEKLLNFAGVKRKAKPRSRSPSPDPKSS